MFLTMNSTQPTKLSLEAGIKENQSLSPFIKKRDEIQILLETHEIDVLGINEANLGINHHDDEVAIPGYKLFWDLGRSHKRRQNSRVVVYVR